MKVLTKEIKEVMFLLDIKLKDYEPKYKLLELIEEKDLMNRKKPPKLIFYDKAVKDFGNRKVLSVRDYDDTHTTSIIIENERKYS